MKSGNGPYEGGPHCSKKSGWDNMASGRGHTSHSLSRSNNRIPLVTFFDKVFIPFRDFNDEVFFPVRDALAPKS